MSDEKKASVPVLEVGGVTLRPTADEYGAWLTAAGDSAVGEWLTALANEAAEAGAEKPIEWPMVVQLRTPVALGQRQITSLTLRRGRLGDIKNMKLVAEMPTEHLFTIASRLSGEPTQVIEQLDMEDAGEVMAAAISFYGTCLTGGRKR